MRRITNLTEAFDTLNKIDRPARRRIKESKSNGDRIGDLMNSILSNIDSEDFQGAIENCDSLKYLIYKLSKNPFKRFDIIINFVDSFEANKIDKEEYIENILKESGLSPDKYHISYMLNQKPQMYVEVILDYFDDKTPDTIMANFSPTPSIIDSIQFKDNKK